MQRGQAEPLVRPALSLHHWEALLSLIIRRQDRFSRGELILRRLFGMIYIGIPHVTLLAIFGIWLVVARLVTFFSVLIFGNFPNGFFDFHRGYLEWYLRVAASIGLLGGFGNLVDGYPAFFPWTKSEKVKLILDRPAHVNRGTAILRFLFGTVYVRLPHYCCLFLRDIASMILAFLAWWAILVTGRYPARWHGFNVGTYRWSVRVYLYLSYLTEEYPPFSGKE